MLMERLKATLHLMATDLVLSPELVVGLRFYTRILCLSQVS